MARSVVIVGFSGATFTNAPNAAVCVLFAMSDAARGNKGITCFLMNMRQPGVDVRPLKQITGSSEFCEVFMTDARIAMTTY